MAPRRDTARPDAPVEIWATGLQWLIAHGSSMRAPWAMKFVRGRFVVVEGHTPEALFARMAHVDAGDSRQELS